MIFSFLESVIIVLFIFFIYPRMKGYCGHKYICCMAKDLLFLTHRLRKLSNSFLTLFELKKKRLFINAKKIVVPSNDYDKVTLILCFTFSQISIFTSIFKYKKYNHKKLLFQNES